MKRLVNVEELAAMLNVSKGWVYEQTSSGSIPFVKVGKYLRFDLQEVLEFFKNKGNLERA